MNVTIFFYTRLLFLTQALLLCASLLQASPTCMDNSWHLEKRYDDKQYHFVSERPSGPCHCPCEKRYKQLSDRGKCTQCAHYHIPQPFIFIKKSATEQGTLHAVGHKSAPVKEYFSAQNAQS